MSPEFVKPYVKSNKNDFLDAEAICEAVARPNMRFVPVKSVEQQDLQHLHRARSQAVAHRTAMANQVRGFLLEYGLTIPKGIEHLRGQLPQIMEDGGNGLSFEMRALLAELRRELVCLDERVRNFDQKLVMICRASDACRRLQTIPGIGPFVPELRQSQ